MALWRVGFRKRLIILVPEEWREEVGVENKQTNRRTDRQAGMLADTLSTAQYRINMRGFWDEADVS